MMSIKKYMPNDSALWDDFLKNCPMATFLHSRAFLAYHQDRFQDESLLIYRGEKLLAVFPAACDVQDAACVVSHPGITYGGLLMPARVNVVVQLDIFKAIFAYYQQKGFKKLVYKPVPDCFKALPSQDDLYAMFFHQGQLIRRDLNCVIPLKKPFFLNSDDRSNMKRRIKKATMHSLILTDDLGYLPSFWQQLNMHLADKYETKTVHTVAEITHLLKMFPDHIQLRLACSEDKIFAGSIIFDFGKTVHTQYLYVNEDGKDVFALDYLLHSAIEGARAQAKEYFSFGISTEEQGKALNAGLYLSKAKHGGVGCVQDFYQINL